ncbi:MAG: acyltransferase family protein, partial [Betaproteobacteria bacterium]|nr:acyltransferase family protein [Betaproteobacteria bacterium]
MLRALSALAGPDMGEERRYYGFDALRGGMMMLGLVIHSAMFYIVSPPPTMPITLDRNQSPLMDVLMHFVHAFRMPAFFLMAGFFASLLVDKRGTADMLKNRAARVLAPLVAGLFTVVPVSILLWMSFAVSVRFGTHDLIPNLEQVRIVAMEAQDRLPEIKTPGALHLWFLYFLCLFYLAVPLLERIAQAVAPADGKLGSGRSAWPLFAVLVVFTCATLWPFQGARVHEGFLTFIPRPHALLYYGQFFVLGYFLNVSRAIGSMRLAHP